MASQGFEDMDLEHKKGDIETASIQSQDVKQRQDFKGWTLFLLAFQAVGTVYGDIGTSPLYVYSSTFSEAPARDELLCCVSLIIWSLAIVVTLKYVLIVLYANDAGEGGTFALYSLLARYASIEDKEPGKATKELNRYKTNEISAPIHGVRSFFEKRRPVKLGIRFAGIFGVCCLLADGVFTPAQSVLGAIQGVRAQNPGLSTGTIIGISIAILVVLFIAQPLGINRLAFAYAPVVTIWLLFNVASAIYNLSKFDAGMFAAFNPYYAGKWFVVRGPAAGFHRLGGILLCFTGVEALFADVGAFSRNAIQLSWLCFAWPALTLTYIGQGKNPSNFANPFFLTLPPGCFWPGLIISILAAIVASQAIITGSFQILSQAMALCYFPRMNIKFTSTIVHNQCYVPLANWLLMIGCIIVTGVFNNTTSLGNAYGLCVILVTMVTTFMVSLVAMLVWRFNPFLVVLPVFLIFGKRCLIV
ncbi:MAG: hypothetical protein CYPHOPRED_005582 [Cyphobasidiales sp. Tagirdzhanova-0007]|nr:MAG: hypothetical protein CYPHOPRED_005582 [Cyphobasidiales sp. Tagirdzhanova-0007]